jgi:hypothetical protein
MFTTSATKKSFADRGGIVYATIGGRISTAAQRKKAWALPRSRGGVGKSIQTLLQLRSRK